MADTSKLGITKPTVGGSTGTWGTELNTALDDLDLALISNNGAEDSDNHAGLDFAYKNIALRVGTTITAIAAGTVTLADDTTNYVEVDVSAGTVVDNATGFTTGDIPLFEVVTAAGAIDTVTDKRAFLVPGHDELLHLSDTPSAYTDDAGKHLQVNAGEEAVEFTDELVGKNLEDYSETVDTEATSGAAYTINLENGNVHDVTLTDNCTFAFSNPPSSGNAGSFTLILRQDGTGSRTTTWPASVDWAGGAAPTLTTTASAVDVLTFVTVDGGTTWYGFLAGADFS